MSSRIEGFAVMDVSSSLHDDPKVKRLAREYPDQLGPGFLAYVATMGESWKAGERLTVQESWPPYLPADPQPTVDALKAVKLLTEDGRVTASAWRGYFVEARKRRNTARDRWDRANKARAAKRSGVNGDDSDVPARSPRGNRGVTAANRTSDRPSVGKKNHSPSARDQKGTTKTTGRTDYDALMGGADDDEHLPFATGGAR